MDMNLDYRFKSIVEKKAKDLQTFLKISSQQGNN